GRGSSGAGVRRGRRGRAPPATGPPPGNGQSLAAEPFPRMRGTLHGLRVLDLTGEIGFLAGTLLGELGADVVKVEPPAGDPARRRPPFWDGVEDPERSLLWLALNTSKR